MFSELSLFEKISLGSVGLLFLAVAGALLLMKRLRMPKDFGANEGQRRELKRKIMTEPEKYTVQK